MLITGGGRLSEVLGERMVLIWEGGIASVS